MSVGDVDTEERAVFLRELAERFARATATIEQLVGDAWGEPLNAETVAELAEMTEGFAAAAAARRAADVDGRRPRATASVATAASRGTYRDLRAEFSAGWVDLGVERAAPTRAGS